MAIARFPISEIEKSIKLDTSLLEKINMLGMPAVIKDKELEVEVFPNRPEMFAYTHFVNAIKAYLGKEKPREYKVLKPGKDHLVTIHPSVKAVRGYGAYAIIKGIKLDDTKIKQLINIQEKIATTTGRNRKKIGIGLFPCEKIKFPLQYLAREPKDIKFIPLGETKELDASTILKTHPMGKEYAHLLENASKYPILVDATGEVLTMPPITNSESTGRVTPSTHELLIEVSGTDKFLVAKVLNILAMMLADMGGTIQGINIKDDTTEVMPFLKPEKKKISLESIKKVLGIELKEKQLASLLERMGHGYEKGNVLVPAYRTDILHEVDLIEDVAIAYGYDKFDIEIPKVATIGQLDPKTQTKTKIIETLVGLGLLEISTLHLIKEEEAEKAGQEENLQVVNSRTEFKILRQDLLVPLLRVISENKDRDYPQKLFEAGTVFSLDSQSETNVKERESLSLALVPGNSTSIKQHLEALFSSFSLSFEVKEKTRKGLIDGRTGLLLSGGKELGYFGEIHPNTLADWGIKMPTAVAEINLDELIKLINQPK